MTNWKSPDVRGWAIIGFFGLTFFLLQMMREQPGFLANASFMQFAQALATGGILLVATNLFGGTKSGVEAAQKMADTVASATPAAPAIDPLAAIAAASTQAALTAWKAANPSAMGLAGVGAAYDAKWDALT